MYTHNKRLWEINMGEVAGPSPEDLQLRTGESEKRVADIEKAWRHASRSNEFRDDIQRIDESHRPDMGPALYVVSELDQLEADIELQAMLIEPAPESELHDEHHRLHTDIDHAVYAKIGDKFHDIDEWLDSPKFVASKSGATGELKYRVDSVPGNSGYDTTRVGVSQGREVMHYRNADFHGDRTHDIDYYLDLSETDAKKEDGAREDYRGIRVKGGYYTDDNGKIIPNSSTRVDIRRFNQDGGSTGENYTGDQALAMLDWLDKKSAALLKEVNPRQADSELYALDSANKRYGHAADYAPVSKLDLEAERKIIEGYSGGN